MITELHLSPEELYYVAKMCGGDHLLYDYIAMMPDIQQRAAVLKEKAMAHLSAMSVIKEDVWGDITISEELIKFLHPVFFSTLDAQADIYQTEIPEKKQSYYFHWAGEQCVELFLYQDRLYLRSLTEEELDSLIVSFMPADYDERSLEELSGLNPEHLSRIMVFRNRDREGTASICRYQIIDSWICVPLENNTYQILNPVEFCTQVKKILKGEE